MKNYLVGGAVRDKLLGIESVDKDWVVVGSSPEKMIARGYKQVGKDFPVFLHPSTKEEYALARKERKIAAGYTGFSTTFSPDVSLEEDLARRDLTINAIAMDESEKIVDPYNGQRDIDAKILRHVTNAFVEDPLRVLRVARFKSRFHHLGFVIAPETVHLMADISKSGELKELPAERVWVETAKALMENSPEQYFYTLKKCGALEALFPEIFRLFGVPQRADYHPEIDTGIHTMMVLSQAVKANAKIDERFAALVHDLGKADTPKDILPKHIGHEHRSIMRVKVLCTRLKVPTQIEKLGLLVAEYHTHCHQALELKPSTIIKLFESLDVFRRPERLESFLIACEADSKGRKDFENSDYPQANFLRKAFIAAKNVDVKSIVAQGFKGAEIGLHLKAERTKSVKELKQLYKN